MDRRHLEDAAVSYAHLRGLLLIPVGGLFLLAALANWDVVQTWVLAAGVVIVGLLWLAIRHHYREHYGSVRTSPRQQARDTIALVLACAIVVGVSMLLRDLPVNAIAIGFAVAMGIGYALGPGLRTHHVVILGALLVAGALPGLGRRRLRQRGAAARRDRGRADRHLRPPRVPPHVRADGRCRSLTSRSTGSSTSRAGSRS